MIETPKILPVHKLIGSEVWNAAGEDLGSVASFGIDLERGRIAYAVLSHGGFMGRGNKWFPIPLGALEYSYHDARFTLNVDKEFLDQAPGFDKDSWPSSEDRNFSSEVFKYYGRTPYWEQP